jgi:DNA-binding NtrC family response regulator
VPIHVPPLRERKEDIPQLVEHFVRLHATGAESRASVDANTMGTLQRYSWPGNIRELQNVIERWAIGYDVEELSLDESAVPAQPADAPVDASVEPELAGTVKLREHVEALERKLIQRTMIAVAGNRSEAARRLGMSRGSLLERLKKYQSMTG